LRVLWVGHNLAYPPVRGVLQRNFNLLREAAKKCEVHVLAFDQFRSRPCHVSPGDCVKALSEFCAEVDWIPISDDYRKNRYWLSLRGLFSRNAFDVNWFASASMATRLQRMLARTSYDAVHFDTLGLAQYRGLVNGEGVVLNHHNIESSMMLDRAAAEKRFGVRQYWALEARKLRNAERRYCPQFPFNLVVSPEDGELLTKLAPGTRTRVVANGVDTEFFSPRVDPGGSTLLFCGGLDWYPNGEAMRYFFDRIWPLLMRRLPTARVLVVGRNPPKWLTQLSASNPCVEVTGFVDDVRKYFRQSAVYFCPIRRGGGTRLKILDALAMGMPLIGTTFACSGIAVEHEKHVLLADTPETFVDQILRALADPGLRAKLADNGRKLVCDKYSWSVVGEKLIGAYMEVASSEQRNRA